MIVERIRNESFSLIRKYTDLAKSVKNSISLAIGEPNFDTDKKIIDEVVNSLRNKETHYCNARGLDDLVDAISAKEKVLKNEVLVTLGGTEALFITLMGIIDPLDEVIVITPSYPHYGHCIRYFGGVCKFLDTSNSDFEPTFNGLIELISEKTKGIIINSPCNPTGIIYQPQTLKMIEVVAKKNNICIICDDVYEEITFYNCKKYKFSLENAVYIKSFSKSYNMTGFRVGYLVSNKFMVDNLLKIHSYLSISLPVFIQRGALVALNDVKPSTSEYVKNLNYCLEALDSLQLSYITPEGGIYIFINILEFDSSSERFCDDLFESYHVACVPGVAFLAEGYIRINYCLCYEDLVLALERFSQYIITLRAR